MNEIQAEAHERLSSRSADAYRTDRELENRSPQGRPSSEPRRKVAYIMSRFPKFTETFVLYEMLAVERCGLEVEVYPLQRERTKRMHPEAVALVERARFAPLVSVGVLRSNLHFLRRKPAAYIGALWTLARANFGSARYFFAALAFFPKTVHFARSMAEEGVDHVHAHFASHPAAAAFVIHRLTGIPFSFTAHGSDLHRDRHMLREKVAEAAFTITISEFNRDLIVKECGERFRDRVKVIHCGVNTEFFRPREHSPEGRPEAPFKVLCVGTLHEVKGQGYLIDACSVLAKRGVRFSCELVGDGPDMSSLRKRAENAGIADRVVFHGARTQADIAELLHGADVVAAPSVPTRNGRREGIPVSLMEAAASGVALVASRITGVPELVEDGAVGLLVNPGDADALADALERLAHDSVLRRKYGDEARRKALREFDLDANARDLCDLFSETRA